MADGRDIFAGLAGELTISVKGWFLVIETRRGTWMRVVPLVFAIVAMAFLTACGGEASEPEPAAEAKVTALDNLAVAESAMASVAADAKLLVLQAPSVTTSGAYPLWVFTFGSPETGQMHKVNVVNGKATAPAPAGAAPLDESEWDSVPQTAAWEIDSDAAYEAAVEVAGLDGRPTEYSLLLETYVPQSATDSKAATFVWYVFLNPGDDGEPEAIIAVNARTGEATVVE